MLQLLQTKAFKKNLKKYQGKHAILQELRYILDLLVHEKSIPLKYPDHMLKGKYNGVRELHIKPDDLLLYIKKDKEKITLIAIGSHSEIF